MHCLGDAQREAIGLLNISKKKTYRLGPPAAVSTRGLHFGEEGGPIRGGGGGPSIGVKRAKATNGGQCSGLMKCIWQHGA